MYNQKYLEPQVKCEQTCQRLRFTATSFCRHTPTTDGRLTERRHRAKNRGRPNGERKTKILLDNNNEAETIIRICQLRIIRVMQRSSLPVSSFGVPPALHFSPIRNLASGK